jgi:hypothetical protein
MMAYWYNYDSGKERATSLSFFGAHCGIKWVGYRPDLIIVHADEICCAISRMVEETDTWTIVEDYINYRLFSVIRNDGKILLLKAAQAFLFNQKDAEAFIKEVRVW